MTIKVCKKKTEERLKITGIVLFYSVQILLPIWFVIGIIQIVNGEPIGIFGAILGGFCTFMVHLFGWLFGYSFITSLQNKYKIFEWNEDC